MPGRDIYPSRMGVSRNTQPTKQMPCSGCGKPQTVNAQVTSPPRCFECGLQAAIDAARQMREKSGPYYDRWLASNGRPEALRGNQHARRR